VIYLSSVETKPTQRPLWRGSIHQAAFFMSLGACGLLLALASTKLVLVSFLVYSFGLLSLFGTSAIYHRLDWSIDARSILKRCDHSAIFLLIAGTFTPVCLLALPDPSGVQLLKIIWSVAVLGILKTIFWTHAPRWLSVLFYIGMGWSILPYLGDLKTSLGETSLIFLALGGVFYSVGAVFYALKKPVLYPKYFGYHELFHSMTLVAAILHFVVIYRLAR
jgi:hemolysin III